MKTTCGRKNIFKRNSMSLYVRVVCDAICSFHIRVLLFFFPFRTKIIAMKINCYHDGCNERETDETRVYCSHFRRIILCGKSKLRKIEKKKKKGDLGIISRNRKRKLRNFVLFTVQEGANDHPSRRIYRSTNKVILEEVHQVSFLLEFF